MSFNPAKDIYSKRVTIHPSITHESLEVITAIAIKKEIATTRVIEDLIKESPTYKEVIKELKESGRFGKIDKTINQG